MNIIILGPQGSGKGTQAELLAKKLNLDHFDAGRALRRVSALDTPLGREVHEIITVRKELVPSRILEEVLRARLADLPREQGIVFDGVPRNAEQAEYFMEILREFGRKIDKVIFIEISKEESIKRIGKRFSCERCKEPAILKENQSAACSKCGGELKQRADDTKEGIEKRLKIYAEKTMPVIEFFEKMNLVAKINGEQTEEEVFSDIARVL